MVMVTIYWASNAGHHDGTAFQSVRKAAIHRAGRGAHGPGNDVGYAAHELLQARGRRRLASVATLVRDGSETSDYDGPLDKIRRIVAEEYGISGFIELEP